MDFLGVICQTVRTYNGCVKQPKRGIMSHLFGGSFWSASGRRPVSKSTSHNRIPFINPGWINMRLNHAPLLRVEIDAGEPEFNITGHLYVRFILPEKQEHYKIAFSITAPSNQHINGDGNLGGLQNITTTISVKNFQLPLDSIIQEWEARSIEQWTRTYPVVMVQKTSTGFVKLDFEAYNFYLGAIIDILSSNVQIAGITFDRGGKNSGIPEHTANAKFEEELEKALEKLASLTMPIPLNN